jgi:hypothetical protein
MSKFKVRALRAALVVPLLMGSALVASAGHASASINPDNVDRPKISAGDRDFKHEDVDHIIIKIDAFENGSWKTKGTAVEYRPQDCTSDFPPI